MNEAGLTLAADDIRESPDGSPSFSTDGTPMSLSFRRVMRDEESPVRGVSICEIGDV